MNPHHPGESVSLWSHSETMPGFDPLVHDAKADVCVIGGGIAGLTTAYLLMKEGKKVCLLESFELGSGQTGRTSAHLSNVLGTRFYDLEKFHGAHGPFMVYESHREAIQKIADIVTLEKIECEFERVDGYLYACDDETDEIIAEEFRTCLRMGMSDVQSTDDGPSQELLGSTSALMFPLQAQFNPLKYMKALAEILKKNGVEIHTHTYVTEVQGGPQALVKTRLGSKVECQAIVVATNSPINDLFAIHTKQYAYRTYVMAFKIPKGKMRKALFWDTQDPYHYLRLEEDEFYDILIAGGEDHKTGQDTHPEDHYAELETWVRQKISFAGEVLHRWSGQVMESMDGIGFLGHNPMDRDNVYVLTGDSGNGLTHSTLGAVIITDQIMGRRNTWEKLYSPSRVSWRALPTFVKENSNVAAQYVDWLTPKPVASVDDIQDGEGDIFRDGAQMIAAYKDETGHTYMMSAACPHLGGLVSWNATEKSWDCPCHGSRFDCYGKVIQGPARSDLQKIETAAMVAQPVPAIDLNLGNEKNLT